MVDIADLFEPDRAVKERIGYLTNYNPRELLEGLASSQLAEVTSAVAQTSELAKKCEYLEFSRLPSDRLHDINETAKQVLSRFGEIKELSKDGANHEEVDSLLTATTNNCQTLLNLIIPTFGYLSPDANSQIQEVNEIASDLRKKVATEMEEIKGKKAELDSIIEVARDTAAQAGVTQHAEAFKQIAVEHANASKRWLIAAGVLITITILAAITTLYLLPAWGDLKEAAVLQRIIGKLIILSSLYYGTAWSAKNYRIHRHLSVVNMHRHNALKTFEAFIKAASGDHETKSAVLLETTRSIFAPTNTGYLGGEDENPNNRIVEIVKTVASNVPAK